MSTVGHYKENDDDYEAITRIFDSHSLLQCPLCKKDFQDPRILCSNGHSFCVLCLQNILPADGILKCPTCKEARRFASSQEITQLTKNHTLQTLKRAEHHRIAQIGVCEICNKKAAYGRCFHCRSLACFKCMDEHEQNVANEHAKEYAELVKIRDNIQQKLLEWDKKLTESKENIRKTIQSDVEKQMKEIKDREQVLHSQLDDLYQTYLSTKNTRLQKLKFDVEKESQELDQIDRKNWSTSERLRLSQYWMDLQRKLDDQSVDFIYQPLSSSNNRSQLGELHLKLPHQDQEYIYRSKYPLFDNHDSLNVYQHPSSSMSHSERESKMKNKKRMIMTDPNSTRFFTQTSPTFDNEGPSRTTVKFSTSRNRARFQDQQNEQEGNDYAVRKVVRTRYQQQGTNNSQLNLNLPNDNDQPIEDNTPLTPRRPIAPIRLNEYNKKATHVLTGPNEADKFLAPKAIAVTETNQLLIADTKKHRIVIYDLNTKSMRGIKGFLFPDGLCLATEQYVIITDRHRVSKYDWFHGRMISFIGSKKEGCTRSTFSWPKGVAIDNHCIYVCDSYNSRMVVLSHQMRYESEWTVMRGTKKLDPQYISISNGLLYVTAWQRIKPESCAYNAGCIIVYSTDGNAQRFIDTDAQSYLNLSVPEGIICDSSKQLILADRYTSKILSMHDDDQSQVIHFRGDRMKAPHYVCFSNDQNTMIVTDVGNNTVQFYERGIHPSLALQPPPPPPLSAHQK